MERFTAEVFQAQRDDRIKQAIKSKMSYPDIMEEFGLSAVELDEFVRKHHLDGGPPRKDDLRDARDEPGKGVNRGRR